MLLDCTPDQLRRGDRIPDLAGDGPAVVSVGPPVEDAEFGTQLPVTLEGVERPRMMPAGTPVRAIRADPDGSS